MEESPRLKVFLGIALFVVLLLWANLVLSGPSKVEMNSQSTPSATYSPKPQPKVALWFGDSFVAGCCSSKPANRMSSIVSRHFGFFEKNLAEGGTGYLAGTDDPELAAQACGKQRCLKLQKVLESRTMLKSDVIFVQAGLNDRFIWSKELQAAIQDFYKALREKYPSALVISLSPVHPSEETLPFRKIQYFAKKYVTEIGGFYLDLGEPLYGHPDWLVKDNFHPNDKGFAALANEAITRIAPIIEKELPKQTSE